MSTEDRAPNTWFQFEHPEHGLLDVAAYVPERATTTKGTEITGVGVAGDAQVTPAEAGIDAATLKKMKTLAMIESRKPKKPVEEGGEIEDDIPW